MENHVKKPVVYFASSHVPVNDLLRESAQTSDNEFILLLKNDKSILNRVLPAYLNSIVRQNDGIARAKTLRMEMLLFIAKTMRIETAIRVCGASGYKFMIVASSTRVLTGFVKKTKIKLGKKCTLSLDYNEASSVSYAGLPTE